MIITSKVKARRTGNYERVKIGMPGGSICLLAVVLGVQRADAGEVAANHPAATTQSDQQISQLIAQLGAPKFSDRVAAQDQLSNAGVDAMPALKKAAEADPDPEIRSRAAAVCMQISTHDALDETLITLHEKDADPQKVLDLLGTQAHAKLQGSGAPVTIDVNQKPYWEVVSELCTQLNVCPAIFEDGSIRFTRVSDNWVTQSPHQIVGPYWISVAGFDLSKTINLFGTTLSQQQFSVRLRVIPEPKLPIKRVYNFSLSEARDDAGNSLLPLIDHEIMLSDGAQIGMYTLESHLTYPDHPGTRVTLLRGQFSVLLATQIHRYKIDDVLGKSVASNEIQGSPVQATVTPGANGLIRVSLVGDRKNLSDSQWSVSDLSLVDSNDHPLVRVDDRSSSAKPRKRTSGESFVLTEVFSLNRGNGKPASSEPSQQKLKLIWDVPMSFKTISIPVEFKDLPMP